MTDTLHFGKAPTRAIPITLIPISIWQGWVKKQSVYTRKWLQSHGVEAKPGNSFLLPDESGKIAQVLVVTEEKLNSWSIAHLPALLPKGHYQLEHKSAEMLALGWILATYEFKRYRKSTKQFPALVLPDALKKSAVAELAASIMLARDLINTPANDMLPSNLAAAAKQVAKECGAEYKEIIGEQLLKQNYPAIHAVGRASTDAPRLIDIRWGNAKHPKVTLVGKGVCFDSGGLDIKTAAGMKMMKKDMAGGAIVLALARIIIKKKLPVRLRVLVPAVENAISGNAFRPLDVISTRKGVHVEIGNTDAEGRIILCDALAEADREKPDLLVDCATLTGSCRTALGTDVPGFFTDHENLARQLQQAADAEQDYMWRLPLWHPYREKLNSPVADIVSCDDSPYAGAITAALFLNEFVSKSTPWVHIDMMAWNLSSKPGRPAGGEAMALRALLRLVEDAFSKPKKKG